MKDPEDKVLFSRAMARLFALYGDELTPTLLQAWWGALEEYSVDEVMQAMNHHAKDPKAGMFRPTPAHLMTHLTETIPRERRQLAAQHQRQLAIALDPHDRAIRQAYSDAQLGLLTAEEAQTLVADEKAKIARITQLHQQALTHEPNEQG